MITEAIPYCWRELHYQFEESVKDATEAVISSCGIMFITG